LARRRRRVVSGCRRRERRYADKQRNCDFAGLCFHYHDQKILCLPLKTSIARDRCPD
jgi:hypothetical protein